MELRFQSTFNLNRRSPDMVATRGEVAEFVLGLGRMNPAEVPTDDWVHIIREILKHAPQRWRGMRSISDILRGNYNSPLEPELILGDPLPTFLYDTDKVVGEKAVFRSRMLSSLLPSTRGEALGDRESFYDYAPSFYPVRSQHVLISRDGTLFLLGATWKSAGMEDDDEPNDMDRMRYQLDYGSLQVTWLDDSMLEDRVVELRQDGINLGLEILKEAFLAQDETCAAMRADVGLAEQRRTKLAGYLQRLGLPLE